MLVFTRCKGETVCIGADIVLKIDDVRKGKVWLSVQAPGDVTVVREKTRERKRPVL